MVDIVNTILVGRSWIEILERTGASVFSKTSKTALGLTKWVTDTLDPRVKRQECQHARLPPSTARVSISGDVQPIAACTGIFIEDIPLC